VAANRSGCVPRILEANNSSIVGSADDSYRHPLVIETAKFSATVALLSEDEGG
jgi:hypothetical protein